MIDVPRQFALIREQCAALKGSDFCTDTVVQVVAAIGRHETGFGSYKPFARPDGWASHNYGAVQCRVVQDKTGACPEGCFPARDTSPKADGSSVGYGACFKVYPDDGAGALDLLKHLTSYRPKVAAVLPTGDAWAVAAAMYDSRYYEGFGKTREDRIKGYAEAILRNGKANAAAARVELAITLEPPPPPEPPPPIDGEDAALGMGALFIASVIARIVKGPSK